MAPRQLVSPSEAALLVGVKRRTIHYWNERGWLAVQRYRRKPYGGRPEPMFDLIDIYHLERTLRVKREQAMADGPE
jgi:hypothetical protein